MNDLKHAAPAPTDALRAIRVNDYDPACSLCREQAGKTNYNTGDFLCNQHALAIGRAALMRGKP